MGCLRSTGSSHTGKDRSTEYYSVVRRDVSLVRISIETNTHLIVRQGSPIFLLFLFPPSNAWLHDRTGRFLLTQKAQKTNQMKGRDIGDPQQYRVRGLIG